MAAKDSNYEDILLRLSDHISGINLILDIVDVNSFPGRSRLEDLIARELINLRGRISHIPASNLAHDNGVPNHVSSSLHLGTKNAASAPLIKVQPDSKKPNGSPAKTSQQLLTKASGPKPTKNQFKKDADPATKNAANIASQVPKPMNALELGRKILREMGETEYFDIYSENHFHCVLCDRAMHANSLLDHINGRGHAKHFPPLESSEDEEDEYADNNCNESHYDPVLDMMDEMNDCSYERSVELMWDIVYAMDHTIDNIESNGKWFFCRRCNKTLNGPFPVVDHVRGSTHNVA